MKLMWGERFQGRYDARVHDTGKAWWLSVKDARTGEVFYECNAGKPFSTMRVADLAFDWRTRVQNAVYRREHWSAIPASVDGCGIPASVDGRRMAETGTGSGRSPTSAVAATSGETPNTPSHSETPDNG